MSKVLKRNTVFIDEETYTIPVTPEKAEIFDKDKENLDKLDIDGYDIEIEEYEESEEEYEKPELIIPKISTISTEDILAERERIIEEREIEFEERIKEKEAENELRRQEIIEQAKKTADLIVSYNLENARKELREAMSQGYSYGFEEGRIEAMNVIAPALEKTKRMADTVSEMQDKMLEDFKDDMFDIISEISNKIIHREIDEKDEYLMTLFSDAIKDIRAENYVTVTVSESQVDFAVRNIELFKEKVANIKDFKIISDINHGKGTMIVETAKSVVDASFNVQVEKVNSIVEEMKENLLIASDASLFVTEKSGNQEQSDEDGAGGFYYKGINEDDGRGDNDIV